MSIDEAYKIVSYLVDKYQGTYIAPDDFNMIINMAQYQYIESIVDGTGNINSNNRNSPEGLISNSSVSDRLSKFYTELTLSVSTANDSTLGKAPKPLLMWAATSLRTSANRPIKKVFDDNLATHLSNAIDAPTVTDPIYMEVSGGTTGSFRFFPSNVVNPILGYIRTPNKMVWAYSGNLVYSENGGPSVIPTSGSAQPEWGDADMNEIIYIAIGLIGINLKDGDLIRASQTIKNEGQ
jgi:hypothetical protein